MNRQSLHGLPNRFVSKIEILPNGCWRWKACIAANGYGRFGPGGRGKMVAAHRYAYEALIGRFPEGMESDHLCKRRDCVNPFHIEPVTHAENMRRARGYTRFKKTHCDNGHPLTMDPAIRTRRDGSRCRICHAAKEKARYWKRKQTSGA